jgi:hypothetical protein
MRQLPFLILLSLPLAAATIDDVKREAALLRELAIKTKVGGNSRTVPLTNLKRAVRDWIEANLVDGSEAQAKRLNAELNAAGLTKVHCTGEDCMYFNMNGTVGEVRFHSPSPGYLIASTGLGIVCGYDTSYYLYRRSNQKWLRILAAEQTDYSEDTYRPAARRSSFLSAPGAQGQRLFAIVSTSQWCTSCGGSIYLRVWRLTGDNVAEVLNRERGVNRCEPSSVNIAPDHLRVEYLDSSIDRSAFTKKVIESWEFRGTSATRLAPVAPTPRDFVDQWLKNEWKGVSAWSAPDLESAHRSLRPNGFAYGTFSGVYRCPPGTWEIAVRVDDGEPAERFFLVSERTPLHFRMERVSTTASPDCKPVR